MWDKIRYWYLENYSQITWFLIGFLAMDALINLSRGNLVGAAISAVLIAINYSFVKR